MAYTLAEFVKAWEEGDNTSDVAEKLEVSKATVQAKASKLRKAGVPLKRFGRGITAEQVNVDNLLTTLAKLRGTTSAKLKTEGAALAKEIQTKGDAFRAKMVKGQKAAKKKATKK